MARDNAYATEQEYKGRVGKESSQDDKEIRQQLTSWSRYIERKLHRVFNQSDASTVFTFDPPGGDLLPIRDLVTFVSMAVDTTRDGSFDTAVAEGDLAFRPLNASFDGVPFTHLYLAPSQTTLGGWPTARASIQITGTWGWAAVPPAIKEAVILLTRHLRDLMEAGATLTLQNLDGTVQQSPDMSRLLHNLTSEYYRPQTEIIR